MPTTSAYPPRPGTVDGATGVATISAYLNNPEWLTRTMATLVDQHFVGDRILQGRAVGIAGMAAYEVSEDIFADGEPELIEPGGVFPSITTGVPKRVIEAIKQLGLSTEIALQAVNQSNWMPVERAERKLGNSIVQAFDMIVMAKVASAAPDMQSVIGSDWSTANADTMLRDILMAAAAVTDARQGYIPDTLLLTSERYIWLVTNENFLRLLQRLRGNDTDLNLPHDGIAIPMPSGVPLQILQHPTSGSPLEDPIVYDSRLLGSIVRDPGLDNGAEDRELPGVAVDSKYYGPSEKSPDGQSQVWRLSVSRARLPIIQEPQAAAIITGTDGE